MSEDDTHNNPTVSHLISATKAVATQPSTQASMTALKIVSIISAISACSFSAAAYALMHQAVQSRHFPRQTAAAFSTSRRGAFAHASLLLVPAVVAIAAVPSDPANALEECGKKSHNCIRTTWGAPPSVVDPRDAAKVVRDVLNS